MDMGEGQEKAAGKNEPCINTQLAAAIPELSLSKTFFFLNTRWPFYTPKCLVPFVH